MTHFRSTLSKGLSRTWLRPQRGSSAGSPAQRRCATPAHARDRCAVRGVCFSDPVGSLQAEAEKDEAEERGKLVLALWVPLGAPHALPSLLRNPTQRTAGRNYGIILCRPKTVNAWQTTPREPCRVAGLGRHAAGLLCTVQLLATCWRNERKHRYEGVATGSRLLV